MDDVSTIYPGPTRMPPQPAPSDWPAWPTYGLIDDLFAVLQRWHHEGKTAALATLVDISGSSPRPLGSEMAISNAGKVAGYVSGGCVEGAVAAEAHEVMRTGTPALLDYAAGSPVLDVQLTCGGRIGIFVRPLVDLGAYVHAPEDARTHRSALTVDIDLAVGSHRLSPTGQPRAQTFRQVYLPPARLLVVGRDPVTLALCRLAPAFGYEIGLLRPYGPSAPPADVPLVHDDTRALRTALADPAPDPWTAVYTLTHDMADDHAVLARALSFPAFCVGALGSRHKTDERRARLAADGFDDRSLARLQTPAGLHINAQAPREIALSILAQIVARRARAAGQRA